VAPGLTRFARAVQALLLFPWVGSGSLRRVRGRSSQVKGACGVAAARALRAPLDLRASATPRAGRADRPGACPSGAQRPRTSAGRVAAGEDRGM